MHQDHLLQYPVIPFEVTPGNSAADLLDRLRAISFQGRNLGTAFRIWQEMLQGETTIFLGLTGALIPAGLRRVLTFLIAQRLVDCVVSTGANLFHDVHEALGGHHYQGTPEADDDLLYAHHIDRMYDTYASEDEFRRVDRLIAGFARSLESRPYTTREFFARLGEDLIQQGAEESMVTSAYRAGVPLYVPALGDSSFGIALAYAREKLGIEFLFDIVADVWETAEIAAQAKSSGVVILGGGTPKNFIQQTEVTAAILDREVRGHDYAIQITQDSPHWGGLSGATFNEARSWGKFSEEAKKVQVFADVTIALPLLASGLADRLKAGLRRPSIPQFDLKAPPLQLFSHPPPEIGKQKVEIGQPP